MKNRAPHKKRRPAVFPGERELAWEYQPYIMSIPVCSVSASMALEA